MTMPDLTPAKFTKRVQTQAAVRRWLFPVVLCTVLGVAPIVLEHTQPADTHGQLAEERVQQANARTEKTKSQITSEQATLGQRQRELQAEQHLTERPDWSGVLSLVARQFGGELMMTGCQLAAANDSRVRTSLGTLRGDVPDDSVWLILSGVAGSNSDVPGLIMRLEGLDLFDRVVMTASQRETIAGGSRTTFTLACRVQ
ncbi:MAG: PilN domain-containing protein [Phycisphaeraceae bacterium]|nr:PilN domain-containing protein [Phycisphaeraceae bacterium]